MTRIKTRHLELFFKRRAHCVGNHRSITKVDKIFLLWLEKYPIGLFSRRFDWVWTRVSFLETRSLLANLVSQMIIRWLEVKVFRRLHPAIMLRFLLLILRRLLIISNVRQFVEFFVLKPYVERIISFEIRFRNCLTYRHVFNWRI